LPIETRATFLLNCILLFAVILEPFIFNILRLGNTANPPPVALFETASSSCELDLGVVVLIMGVFTLALADEEKLLVPASMTRQLRLEAVIWFVSSGVFLISAVLIFGRSMSVATW